MRATEESTDRRKKLCANWQKHNPSFYLMLCRNLRTQKMCPKCANFGWKKLRRKFSHLAEMAAVIPKEFKSNLVSFCLRNETSDTVYHLPGNLHAPTDLAGIKKPGIYLLIHKMCTNAVQIFKSCTEHFGCACDWFNLIKWRQNASGFARIWFDWSLVDIAAAAALAMISFWLRVHVSAGSIQHEACHWAAL